MLTRRLIALGTIGALALFSPRAPQAALSTVSSQVTLSTATPVGKVVTLKIRCDNSAAITGTGPAGGETCSTGTWWTESGSKAIDATGAKLVTFSAREYGTGSAQLGLFNCVLPVGVGTITGVNAPGVDSPTQAPTPAVPSPLCWRLNVDKEGATVALDGVSTPAINWSNQTFDFLVPYMDNCTGNCDLSAQLRVVW